LIDINVLKISDMHPQTEQILGSLELLVESVPCISLSGHEDGGYMYPFVWEASQNGEFNAFNLSLSQGGLKLTDKDIALKSWQEMKYFHLYEKIIDNQHKWDIRLNQITNLFQTLNENLQDLMFFTLKSGSYNNDICLVAGKTIDDTWIAATHTLYKETKISQEEILRTEINQSNSSLSLNNNTLHLISEIEKIISELGTISLQGDFGGGYYYNYDHKFVYGVAKTKEQAIAKALQAAGTLEVSQFHSFYPNRKDFGEYEGYSNRRKPEQFDKLNQFFANKFSEVMMYRFSFWTAENIYIIGETNSGDRAGIYIASSFVYNP